MIKDIKKFQDLSLEEKKEVLEWRNSDFVRQFMYDKNKISLQNHLKFIDNLDEKKIYLKVADLGVVNFKIFDKYVEFGIHKNPYKQKVGSKLLEIGINEAFKYQNKIILYVYEDNIKAINLYKKFGFIEVDKKDNLIKMELKNENRTV